MYYGKNIEISISGGKKLKCDNNTRFVCFGLT